MVGVPWLAKDAAMTAIYQPDSAATIFDGLCRVYSTCADCGELMQVITAEQQYHPCCRERISLRHEDIATAAMDYTTWGWPVFPLAAQSKKPFIPKSKGGKGFRDATTDTDRIYRWWQRHPQHNIGLRCGQMFDVIDVDTKDNKGNPSTAGIESFSKALHDGDVPDIHAIAVTPSGGLHCYVQRSGKRSFLGFRPGIDYRGHDGYVVAPPSQLTNGEYRWLVAPSPKIKEDNSFD